MSSLDVLAFDTYREVLQSWIDLEPRRSQTTLARKVGVSRSRVSMIVQGRRQLPLALAIPWGRALGLADVDLSTFEAMVRQEEGESLALRRLARQHIGALRALRQASHVDDGRVALIERWFVPVILELAGSGRLVLDAQWLSQRLWPSVPAEEIAPVLDELQRMGVLVDDGDGVKTDHTALATARRPSANAGRAARRYHRQQLEHADLALHELSADRRYLASLTVALPADRIKDLIEAVHRFPLEISAPYRDLEGADEVVQVSVQVFQRTRNDVPE